MVASGINFQYFIRDININKQVDIIVSSCDIDGVDEGILEVVHTLLRKEIKVNIIKESLKCYIARALIEAENWESGCSGCLFSSNGQSAHMAYGGCLYEDP